MSTVVDNKIVEMQFDNRDFERNAKASINTLDKLKEALNFDDVRDGFSDLQRSAKKVDFSPLSEGINTVSVKISAMQIAAIAAITNITNRIVDAGINLSKSLSIDQVTVGFSKYAQKTQSVKTIMAATAEELAETGDQMGYVTNQLERLNSFTDETSYNFVDMVDSIGKFTSAGVGLDASVTAMMGIANWAAISGANAAQASNAMRNLSQSLGQGKVRLQDWMSIENANMATMEFKNMALEIAYQEKKITKDAEGNYKTLGKATKSMIKDINDATGELYMKQGWEDGIKIDAATFRDSLKHDWFTTDILNKVLDRYGAFSNKMLEYIDGTDVTATEMLHHIDDYLNGEAVDYEELAKDLSDANAGIVVSADEAKEMIEELSSGTYDLGRRAFKAAQEATTFEEAINSVKDAASTKWMQIFEQIFGNYEQAKKLWTWLAEELYDVFIPGLEDAKDALKEWNEALGRDTLFGTKKGEEGAIINIWNNFKNVLEAVREAFEEVFPPKTGEDILNITKKFQEFTKNSLLTEDALDRIKKSVSGFLYVFKTIGFVVKNVFNAIIKPIKAVFSMRKAVDSISKKTATFGEKMKEMYENISNPSTESGKRFADFIARLEEAMTSLATNVAKIFRKIKSLIPSIWGAVVSVFENSIEAIRKLWGVIKGFVEDVTGMSLWDLLDKIIEKCKGAADAIKQFFDSLRGVNQGDDEAKKMEKKFAPLIKFWNGLKRFFKGVWDVLVSMTPLFNRLFELLGDFFEKLGERISAGASDIDPDAVVGLTGLAGIVAIFAIIKSKLAGATGGLGVFKKLKEAGESISGFFDQLTNGIHVRNLLMVAAATVAVAVALSILTDLGVEHKGELAAAATTIGSLLGAVFLGLKYLSKGSATISKEGDKWTKTSKQWSALAGAILAASASLLLISFALRTIQNGMEKNPASMGAAIGVMISILSILGLFVAAVGYFNSYFKDAKQMNKTIKSIGTMFMLISIALRIIASVMKNIGTLPYEQVVQGFAFTAGILGMMGAIVLLITKDSTSMFSGKNILSSENSAGKILAVGGGFLMMGIALANVAAVMVGLGFMPYDKLVQGFAFTAGILGMMGIVMKLVAGVDYKTQSNWKTLISASAGIWLIAKALVKTALVMVVFSFMSVDKLMKGAGFAISVLVVMALLVRYIAETPAIDGGAWKNILAASFGMTLISNALIIATLAIIPMSFIPIDKLSVGVVAAITILITMAFIVRMMASSIDSGAQIAGIIVAAAAMVVLGIALAEVAAIIIVLSLFPADKITGAALVVSGIMLTMAIVIAASAKFAESGSSVAGIIVAAAAMIVIGIALSIISNIIVNLASIDGSKLWSATGVILALILVMGLVVTMIAAVSKVPTAIVGMIAGAAAMVIIGLALTIIGNVIMDIANSKVKGERLWSAAGMVLAIITVLGLILALIAKTTSTGLGSIGIIAFAASFVIIAIALMLLVEPLQQIADISKKGGLLDAVAAVAVIILVIGLMSVLAGATGGLGAIAIVAFAASVVIVALSMLVLAEALDKLSDIDYGFLGNFTKTLLAMSGELLLAAVPLTTGSVGLLAFAGAAALLADSVTRDFAWALADFTNCIGTLAGIRWGILKKDGSDALREYAAAVDVLSDSMTKFTDSITFIATTLMLIATNEMISKFCSSIISQFMSFFGSAGTSKKMEDQGAGLVNDVLNGIDKESQSTTFTKIIDDFAKTVKEKIDKSLSDLKDTGAKAVEYIGDGISESAKKIQEEAEHIPEGIAEGTEAGLGIVGKAIKKLGSAIRGIFQKDMDMHSPSKVFEMFGGFIDQGLVNGLLGGLGSTEDAGSEVGNSVIDGLMGSFSSFDLSDMDLDTMTSGVTDFFSGMDMSSMLGMDNISESLSGLTDGSLFDMDSILGDFSNPLSSLSDDMTNSDDFTITPVLDLSEVMGGMDTIDSMFNTDQSIGLANITKADMNNNAIANQNNLNAERDNIVAAIVSLHEEVTALSQVVGNLQVIMDTGELVGAIVGPMDEALGKRAAYGSRGI